MANVTVKMGVSGVSDFKRGMKESQEAVKTLTEALKFNEEQLKLTGNEEGYLEGQVSLLKAQIEAQTEVVRNAEAALKAMQQNGTDPNSVAFQKMQQQATKAATELTKMKAELKKVEEGASGAEDETEDMNEELKKIGKGVSFENVTSGLNSVITKLESGARAAVNFGKKMLRYVEDSAEWADELKTLSAQTGYGVEDLQRMQNVAEIIDTSTDAIVNAQSRMKKAATTEGGKKTLEETLGITLNGQSPEDLFWECGEAILAMGDAYEQEAAAQAIFGRNWKELLPLFTTGRDAYEEMLADQNVLSEDDVNKLGEVSDKLVEVNNEIERIKNQFIADHADTILALLQWFESHYEVIVAGIVAIGGALTALKIGEFVVNLQKAVNGFRTLIGLGGNGTGTPTGGNPTTTGTDTGGGGGLKGLWSWASNKLSLFGAGGGWSVAAPIAAMVAGGYIGSKMIEANLNDSRYNKIYGHQGEADLLDRMTPEQWALAARYAQLYQDESQWEEYDGIRYASDALLEATQALNDSFDSDEVSQFYATQYINDILDAYDRGMDEGQYDRFNRMASEAGYNITGTNTLTSSDLANFNGLPGQIARAVESANIRVYIDGALAGSTLAPHVGAAMGNVIAGLAR